MRAGLPPKGDPRAGFNLLTLCFLVVAASLMLVASLPGQRAGDSVMKAADTHAKLAVVEQKMVEFMAKNGRRPCPASGQYDVNTSDFGIEAANPGTCTGGTPAAPLAGNATSTVTITGVTQANPCSITAANSFSAGDVVYISGVGGMTQLNNNYFMLASAGAGSFTIANTSGTAINCSNYPAYIAGGIATRAGAVAGTIPTKSLGLDDSYAFDQWGRRITYMVDTRATQGEWSCADTETADLLRPFMGQGGIVIKNSTSGSAIDQTMYAYISHGPDGHGAFPAQGSDALHRINTGTADADKLTNASENSSHGVSFTNVKVQKTPTSTYGDLTYYTDYLKNTCCVGAYCANYGALVQGNGNAGWSVATGDINGDGISDLIIGAEAQNGGIGYVYVIFGTPFGFANPLPIGSLNGTNGFRLSGPSAGIRVGSSLALADVNGDGYTDLIIGAWGANSNAGYTYVVYGGPTRKSGTAWAASQTLNTGGTNIINGIDGFRLDGFTANDYSGWSAAAGDVNKDGYADIVIGAPGGNSVWGYGPTGNGHAYIVFGNATPMQTTTANITAGSNTVTVTSYTGMVVGQTVSASGIPKGTIITACGGSAACSSTSLTLSSIATVTASGTAFSTSSTLPMTTANTTSGSPTVTVASYAGLIVGQTVSGAGIPNGTTIASCTGGSGTSCATATSLTLSANATATASGTALYVATTPLDPTNFVNGINAVRFDGTAALAEVGNSVATGDINGDGYDDVIIGSPNANSGAGFTYVVFGGTGPLSDPTHTWATSSTYYTSGTPGDYVLNLPGTGTGFINGTNGFRIDGISYAGGGFGWSVATGDVNGDGYADIVIGDMGINAWTGYVYVVFGGTGPKDGSGTWASSTDAASTGDYVANLPGTGTGFINGTNGFRLDGISSSRAGYSVAAGDVNGDGYADIIIGAELASFTATNSGSAYVVFGGPGPGGSGSWGTSSFAASTGDYVLNLPGTGTGFINGTNGFRIDGVQANYETGTAVASGDVNGDHIADILMSADLMTANGYIYTIYGRKNTAQWPNPFELGTYIHP